MHLIVVRLVSRVDDRTELDETYVRRLVIVEATSTERLEHVRVRAGPGRVDLVLAMIAENEPDALLRARAICKRVTDFSLPGWRIAAD